MAYTYTYNDPWYFWALVKIKKRSCPMDQEITGSISPGIGGRKKRMCVILRAALNLFILFD
jgi:hypothetical protein